MRDEILKYGSYLWAERKRWALFASPLIVLGILIALLQSPSYTVKVNLFPKESGLKGGGGGLSFGGLSLSPFQNTLIDKMDFMIQTEEIADMVVRRDSLMPDLYPKIWDPARRAWTATAPTGRDGAQRLMKTLKTAPGKAFLEVVVTTRGPALSLRVMKGYLAVMNEKMRADARLDMERNVAFLQSQLDQTQDPLMRDKLQELIASQIENFMYQGASAFDVIGDLRRPLKPDSSKRIPIVIVSILAGFLFSGLFLVFLRERKAWARAWAEARAQRS